MLGHVGTDTARVGCHSDEAVPAEAMFRRRCTLKAGDAS